MSVDIVVATITAVCNFVIHMTAVCIHEGHIHYNE
jgi:hypothetical protein